MHDQNLIGMDMAQPGSERTAVHTWPEMDIITLAPPCHSEAYTDLLKHIGRGLSQHLMMPVMPENKHSSLQEDQFRLKRQSAMVMGVVKHVDKEWTNCIKMYIQKSRGKTYKGKSKKWARRRRNKYRKMKTQTLIVDTETAYDFSIMNPKGVAKYT